MKGYLAPTCQPGLWLRVIQMPRECSLGRSCCLQARKAEDSILARPSWHQG